MRARALTISAILTLCAMPATAQLQSTHQIRCLKELWKSAVQVSQAQGKDDVACAKSAALGNLSPMTAQGCLSADMKQQVAKKQQRTVLVAGPKCAVETPTYGATDPATVNAVGSQTQIDLVADLFGNDLDGALVACDEDRGACNCQKKALKAAVDLSVGQLKEYTSCAKNAVTVNKLPFLGGVLSPTELERCLWDDSIASSVASDDRGTVAKSAAKLSAVVLSKCEGSGLFPASCGDEIGADLATCIEDRVDCRSCLAINAMFDLNVDCDAYDDSTANASCG